MLVLLRFMTTRNFLAGDCWHAVAGEHLRNSRTVKVSRLVHFPTIQSHGRAHEEIQELKNSKQFRSSTGTSNINSECVDSGLESGCFDDK